MKSLYPVGTVRMTVKTHMLRYIVGHIVYYADYKRYRLSLLLPLATIESPEKCN